MEDILNEMEIAEKLFDILDEFPTEIIDRIELVCNIILSTRRGEFD